MKTEETIFAEAMAIETPDARSAFFDQACGGDSLRQQVEALLNANDRAIDFMRAPAPALGVTAAVDSAGSPDDHSLRSEPLGTTVDQHPALDNAGVSDAQIDADSAGRCS